MGARTRAHSSGLGSRSNWTRPDAASSWNTTMPTHGKPCAMRRVMAAIFSNVASGSHGATASWTPAMPNGLLIVASLGTAVVPLAVLPRVEKVTQSVAHEVEGQHG